MTFRFPSGMQLYLLILVLVLSACGGSPTPEPATPPTELSLQEPTREPDATATEAPTATETPSAEPSNAVTSLQGVRNATIQIEAQGSFVDPEFGLQLNNAGAGSGFLIDESGLAVTNNHVVTGAALLRVYVGGEDRARNARVLGVSECSDLALIDLEGDDYPYLEWFPGTLDVGMDVYAAGFPLGDPEFTLTRGIVSKARTSGETEWASVDEVLEHDATINPGNSGGPLVTADGQVVGINYAGTSNTDQYFAIRRDEAEELLDQLREGDVTSIGINGTAVSDGESLTGIWVASVKSGSPADRTGIRPGDIITSMEGLVLATDGTMSDYCDILRSRDADDVINVEVLRFETEEVLEGQLNGRELEQTVSFAQTLAEEVEEAPPPADSDDGTTESTYTEYTSITDDSGQLTVEVPVEWSDTNGGAWLSSEDEEIGVAVSAAPNLDDYNTTWTTPGFFFGASSVLVETMTEDDLVDSVDFSEGCEYGGREPYEDPLYTGVYDIWTNCGGDGVLFIVLATTPEDRSFISLVEVQIVTEADLDALDRILNTFVVSTPLQ